MTANPKSEYRNTKQLVLKILGELCVLCGKIIITTEVTERHGENSEITQCSPCG